MFAIFIRYIGKINRGEFAVRTKGRRRRKGTAKFAMFKDGTQIVHIIDAIIDSAQQGKWVVVK
ncbi:hypothetical protein P7M33_00070 [Bisgaard Taxon 10/6]|nr:hypothetical protein [Exercitatus varius]